MQDVFLRLQARASDAPIDNVQGYFFRVAAHVLVDRRRHEGARGLGRLMPLDAASDPVEDLSPERTPDRQAGLFSADPGAISRLPPRMSGGLHLPPL